MGFVHGGAAAGVAENAGLMSLPVSAR
jgi:hypothetical protein